MLDIVLWSIGIGVVLNAIGAIALSVRVRRLEDLTNHLGREGDDDE